MVLQKRLDDVVFGEVPAELTIDKDYKDLKPVFNQEKINDILKNKDKCLEDIQDVIKYEAMLFSLCYKVVGEKYTVSDIFNFVVNNTENIKEIEKFLHENSIVISVYDHKTYFEVKDLKSKKQEMYQRRKSNKIKGDRED